MELIYLDVWGPCCIESIVGFSFFLTIVDDFTRAMWVFLIKSKEEVFESYVTFFKMLTKQFQVNIKIIRSDNGTEFTNLHVKAFNENNGIVHQTSCVYTPQKNRVVERKHKHILNIAR